MEALAIPAQYTMKRVHHMGILNARAAEYWSAETVVAPPFYGTGWCRRHTNAALTGLWRCFATGNDAEDDRTEVLVFLKVIVLSLFKWTVNGKFRMLGFMTDCNNMLTLFLTGNGPTSSSKTSSACCPDCICVLEGVWIPECPAILFCDNEGSRGIGS